MTGVPGNVAVPRAGGEPRHNRLIRVPAWRRGRHWAGRTDCARPGQAKLFVKQSATPCGRETARVVLGRRSAKKEGSLFPPPVALSGGLGFPRRAAAQGYDDSLGSRSQLQSSQSAQVAVPASILPMIAARSARRQFRSDLARVLLWGAISGGSSRTDDARTVTNDRRGRAPGGGSGQCG